MESLFLECACGCMEHTLRVVLDKDDDFDYLYTEIHLTPYPGAFWKRIWIGLKYICGVRSRYGHFDSWMLKPEQVSKLKELVERYEPQRKIQA